MAEAGIASHLRSYVPWWARILCKLVLSRIPVRYQGWTALGVFRHGQMDSPDYAVSVFRRHFDRVEFARKDGGFTALELGPGDSAASAIIARAFGAKSCYLVDSGNFANGNARGYHRVTHFLEKFGLHSKEVPVNATLPAILAQFGGVYLTNGLDSLRSIPDRSVDFVWSQAVLEHVRLKDFDETMHHMRRVLRSDGVCSHRIDFRDHLGGSLNNLRFSESMWEADWMVNSGFYTNRIQLHEMVSRFENAGFQVSIVQVDRWTSLPISKKKLARKFASLSDGALLIKGCDVILTPVTE